MLGCDLLTSAGASSLTLMKPDGHILANTHEMMTGSFVQDRNFALPGHDMQARLATAVPEGQYHLVSATKHAETLLGDSIGANLFMLGAAWQLGLIPLGRGAIEEGDPPERRGDRAEPCRICLGTCLGGGP